MDAVTQVPKFRAFSRQKEQGKGRDAASPRVYGPRQAKRAVERLRERVPATSFRSTSPGWQRSLFQLPRARLPPTSVPRVETILVVEDD